MDPEAVIDLRDRDPIQCTDCNVLLELKVCKSAAGWYVGTWCKCGPYSRESVYYASRSEVAKLLVSGTWERR